MSLDKWLNGKIVTSKVSSETQDKGNARRASASSREENSLSNSPSRKKPKVESFIFKSGITSPRSHHVSETIYSLACFKKSAHYAIGLEGKGLEIRKCSDTNSLENETMWSDPTFSNDPIEDMIVNVNDSLLYTSNDSISVIYSSGTLERYRFNKNYAVDGFATRIAIPDSHPELLAAGTTNGTVHLIDLREKMHSDPKVFKNMHAVTTGPKAQRLYPQISALAWIDGFRLATGNNVYGSMKLWDIRMPKKSAISQACLSKSPINSICAGNGMIYALSRNSEVHVLESLDLTKDWSYSNSDILKVNSLKPQIDLLPNNTVAIGGCNGLSLFQQTKETNESLDRTVESTEKCSFKGKWDLIKDEDCVTSKDCLSSEISVVKYHSFARQLLATDTNKVLLYSIPPSDV